MYTFGSFILALFFVFSLMPFASYRLMINEQGKVALIYGDYHNVQLDEYNIHHTKLLFDAIKGAPSFKACNCITGILKDTSDNTITYPAKTFEYIETHKEPLLERVNFQAADPRDERITAYLRAFMYACELKLNSKVPLDTLGVTLFEGMPIAKGSKILLSELFNYLKKVQKLMLPWLEVYKSDSLERKILEKKMQEFESNTEILRTTISILPKDLSFQDTMLFLLSVKPIYECRNVFLEIKKLLDLTVHEYAVIAYLHNFLTDQKNNYGTMCIVSEDQSRALQTALTELGYKIVHSSSIYVPGYGRWGKSKIEQPTNFNANLVSVFVLFNSIRIAYEENCFSELAIPFIAEFVQEKLVTEAVSKKGASISCDTCLKSTGNLMCCSICKDIYYCSVACQKKDWNEHKKQCNKSNVL